VTETRTARIGLSEEAVVLVRIKDGVHQSLGDAMENLAAALAETGAQRRPVLVDIRHAQPLEAEVLHRYSDEVLSKDFSAFALLVEESPLGLTMGNTYLRITHLGMPTELFTDEARALEWLKRYRA